ncbi:hypothetical protein SVIOM74S_10436 [Streptomyces violarus]
MWPPCPRSAIRRPKSRQPWITPHRLTSRTFSSPRRGAKKTGTADPGVVPGPPPRLGGAAGRFPGLGRAVPQGSGAPAGGTTRRWGRRRRVRSRPPRGGGVGGPRAPPRAARPWQQLPADLAGLPATGAAPSRRTPAEQLCEGGGMPLGLLAAPLVGRGPEGPPGRAGGGAAARGGCAGGATRRVPRPRGGGAPRGTSRPAPGRRSGGAPARSGDWGAEAPSRAGWAPVGGGRERRRGRGNRPRLRAGRRVAAQGASRGPGRGWRGGGPVGAGPAGAPGPGAAGSC